MFYDLITLSEEGILSYMLAFLSGAEQTDPGRLEAPGLFEQAGSQ
jgi:hypothetical protein